jgi:very-short-patch-repair endonuclease
MMHGLKHIDLDLLGAEGRESTALILGAQASKIQDTRCVLRGESIGHALYGLHSITPGRFKEQGRLAYAELLEALGEKIVLSDEPMSAQSIGLGLYGLRSIDLQVVSHNHYAGITTIMRAMAVKIEHSSDEFSAQDIGNALTGIRNIDAAMLPQDVRDAYTTLLGSLASKVKDATSPLDSQTIGRALYSFKCISLSSFDKRGRQSIGRLMHGVASKIMQSPAALCDVEVANALYGLNGIDVRLLPQAGQNAFRYMLAYLASQPLVTRQEAVLSQSLRALSNMTAHNVHCDHQASFQRLAQTCLSQLYMARLSPIAKLGILEDLLILQEHAGIASESYAQKLFQGLEQSSLEDPFIVLGLVQIYSLYKRPVPAAISDAYLTLTLKQGSSELETSVAQSLSKDGLLKDIETSIFLNGFELDIASKTQKINVEIDGRRHDSAGSKSKDRLRDAFFARYGWTVLRVPARYGMNAEDVTAQVREILTAAGHVHASTKRSVSS